MGGFGGQTGKRPLLLKKKKLLEKNFLFPKRGGHGGGVGA